MGPPTVVDGKARARGGWISRPMASMGPPTVVDGKRLPRARPACPARASMGPPTVVDGKTARSTSALLGDPCVNGAADCCRRKDVVFWTVVLVWPPLQWGRRLLSTERLSAPSRGLSYSGLQWGRRLLSTERRAGAGRPRRHRAASMGPPTVVDGKASQDRGESGHPVCFNGAADCCRRKVVEDRDHHRGRADASMGPH